MFKSKFCDYYFEILHSNKTEISPENNPSLKLELNHSLLFQVQNEHMSEVFR